MLGLGSSDRECKSPRTDQFHIKQNPVMAPLKRSHRHVRIPEPMKTTLLVPERPAEPLLDQEQSAQIAKQITKQRAAPTTASKPPKATRFSRLLDAFYFWSLSR